MIGLSRRRDDRQIKTYGFEIAKARYVNAIFLRDNLRGGKLKEKKKKKKEGRTVGHDIE